jgi:putative tricarboxylic transport membrane protein
MKRVTGEARTTRDVSEPPEPGAIARDAEPTPGAGGVAGAAEPAGPDGPVGDAEPAGPPVSARAGDLVAGLLFVAIGLFVLYTGRDLVFQGEFAAGPGFFPRILAIILVVVGGALAIKQFVRPAQGQVPIPSGPGAMKIAATFAALLVAVLLIEELGFILTASLLIAVLLFGVERKFTITAVVVSIALPVAFWTLFVVLLGARLPAGLVSF